MPASANKDRSRTTFASFITQVFDLYHDVVDHTHLEEILTEEEKSLFEENPVLLKEKILQSARSYLQTCLSKVDLSQSVRASLLIKWEAKFLKSFQALLEQKELVKQLEQSAMQKDTSATHSKHSEIKALTHKISRAVMRNPNVQVLEQMYFLHDVIKKEFVHTSDAGIEWLLAGAPAGRGGFRDAKSFKEFFSKSPNDITPSRLVTAITTIATAISYRAIDAGFVTPPAIPDPSHGGYYMHRKIKALIPGTALVPIIQQHTYTARAVDEARDNCGLVKLTQKLDTAHLKSLMSIMGKSQLYILHKNKVYFIDNSRYQIERIQTLDTTKRRELTGLFTETTGKVHAASEENLKKITSLTGHRHIIENFVEAYQDDISEVSDVDYQEEKRPKKTSPKKIYKERLDPSVPELSWPAAAHHGNIPIRCHVSGTAPLALAAIQQLYRLSGNTWFDDDNHVREFAGATILPSYERADFHTIAETAAGIDYYLEARTGKKICTTLTPQQALDNGLQYMALASDANVGLTITQLSHLIINKTNNLPALSQPTFSEQLGIIKNSQDGTLVTNILQSILQEIHTSQTIPISDKILKLHQMLSMLNLSKLSHNNKQIFGFFSKNENTPFYQNSLNILKTSLLFELEKAPLGSLSRDDVLRAKDILKTHKTSGAHIIAAKSINDPRFKKHEVQLEREHAAPRNGYR